ncbi:STAS-like domain-containing protein [Floridanema evergladense]|uniref:STAS-like domain-containing protein n=1 Tax=Floridaenema evergladense BLCC-F167 TaxID=3153639 RepID=A0ABV4WVY1_9CYAN
MKHNIYDLIGKACMTPEEGQKVYNLIYPELMANRPVELDFAGVDIFASPFFNFAIGQLLKDISSDTLNRLLKFSHLNAIGKQVLQRVMENSQQYYSNEKIRKAIDEVVSELANSL